MLRVPIETFFKVQKINFQLRARDFIPSGFFREKITFAKFCKKISSKKT